MNGCISTVTYFEGRPLTSRFDLRKVSNNTHLSTSKVFRSNCLFVNFKPQTNTADKGVLLLQTKDKTHSFFDDSRQRVCGLLKIYSVFWEDFVVF